MSTGDRADAPSDALFTDVSLVAGIRFLHYRHTSDFMPFGAGVVVLDFNGDGNQDIYTPKSADPRNIYAKTVNALYRNNGDGTFKDVAFSAGVSDPDGKGNGGCAADYDNDGHQDLFITNWGSSKLFRNDGDGTFTDVSGAAGVGDPDDTYRSMGCAWGDYDRDGYVDLVVVRHVNEAEFNAKSGITPSAVRSLSLYHNNGDGKFSNVTSLLGDTSGPKGGDGEHYGNVWGVGFQPGWVDFNNDRYPDLYVVNDFGPEVQPNVLWRNDGPDNDGSWKFTDISSGSGADAAIFGMGLAVGDYNLDGHLDLYVTNMGETVLLANKGDGKRFTNVTKDAGVGIASLEGQDRITWGNVFFDYDNDGDEDLYVVSGFLDADLTANPRLQPNVLLRNNGDGTFTDVSVRSGVDDPGIGRGAAYLDYNNDGCLDLFVGNLGVSPELPQRAKLFRNNCTSGNNWLIIKVVGTVSSRDAIGTRVEVVSGGRTQIREVAAGGSNKSQSMLPVHFGLDQAEKVDTITIRWPSGAVQTLRDVAVNQRMTIMESP